MGRERRNLAPLGTVPRLAFGMACGVMIVATAFAASRANSAWAGPMLWLGQAVLYSVPAGLLVLRRPISRVEGLGIAWLVPLATYAITEAYSPTQFRFLDEFLTVRTTQAIMSTHHLFHVNPSLLVSPQFPGIELVTTALASVSHLSIFASASIVVGAAHVLLGLGIYLLMLEVTNRTRLAALAALVYATGPHFQFFDSYFIYEALALPLMVACLLAVVKMIKTPNWNVSTGWGIAALALAGATTVTHHVTALALLGFLLLIELGQLLGRRRAHHDWRVLAVTGLAAVLVVLWDVGVATNTIAYLAPILTGLLHSLSLNSILTHGSGGATAPPTGPAFDLALEYASVLLLYVLAGLGVWRAWRAGRRANWGLSFAFAAASATMILGVAVRVLVRDGAQLYGRASSYFMIPASLSIAIAISGSRIPKLWVAWTSGRRVTKNAWRWLGIVAIVLMGLGGIAGGWPPYYARLPGAFLVEGWERSTDQHNIDLATWAARNLPPNYGVASVDMTSNLLSSVGHEAAPALSGVAPLFLSPTFLPSARQVVRRLRIDFIVVDKRMARQIPADGSYFAGDPRANQYRSPIPERDLEKFNTVPGLSRIFSDGTMVVYAVAGSAYRAAPTRKS